MENNNQKKAAILARQFSKEYGFLTYSGILALESALRLAGINALDKVLFNGLACYSVLQAVNNVGAIPVLLYPENDISLKEKDIVSCISKYDIKCFIAIHQYGILQKIEYIKQCCPDLIIIEDTSQAWNYYWNDNRYHECSDFIVTSFGTTKPLSFGIGGAVLLNNSNLFDYVDFKDRESRYKERMVVSYALPADYPIDIVNLMEVANSIVKTQREQAYQHYTLLSESPFAPQWDNADIDIYSWHRYPVSIPLIREDEFSEFLKNEGILYQKEYKVPLCNLKIANNAIIVNKCQTSKLFLLRTRITL